MYRVQKGAFLRYFKQNNLLIFKKELFYETFQ